LVVPTDWLGNFDLKSGRVRCHGNFKILWGPNRDWARTSTNIQYLLQKLVIFFAIPKGEVINDPGIGCCLHRYLFDKQTSSTLVELRSELEYDLKNQLPELGVKSVKTQVNKQNRDAVDIQLLSDKFSLLLSASRDDILNIDLLNVVGAIT
jgi:hypothetical protein